MWNDITAGLLCSQVKYGAVNSEREEMKTQISHMQAELQELREASERRVASDRVEVRDRVGVSVFPVQAVYI